MLFFWKILKPTGVQEKEYVELKWNQKTLNGVERRMGINVSNTSLFWKFWGYFWVTGSAYVTAA